MKADTSRKQGGHRSITNYLPVAYPIKMVEGLFELTSFQRDLLYVAAGQNRASGQQIKEEIERKYNEITHGRLYPNLDTLADKGYIEKGQINRRTNYYMATDRGHEALATRREWEDQYVDLD